MKNLKQFSPALGTFTVRPAIALIIFYRRVFSPQHGAIGRIFTVLLPCGFRFYGCRFFPSCSEYAEKAIRQYGLLQGFVMSLYRIMRCNPWSRGGYDPAE